MVRLCAVALRIKPLSAQAASSLWCSPRWRRHLSWRRSDVSYWVCHTAATCSYGSRLRQGQPMSFGASCCAGAEEVCRLRALQAAQTAAGLSSTCDDPTATSGAASPHIHQELMQLHRYTPSASLELLVMSWCLPSSQAGGIGGWPLRCNVGDQPGACV
jgi:hypothetical protein